MTQDLKTAVLWLEKIVFTYLDQSLKDGSEQPMFDFNLSNGDEPLAKLVNENCLSLDELIILLLSLVPHLRPGFYRQVIAKYLPDGGDLPEFGGVRGTQHRDILPTGETAQFILAGYDIEKRLYLQNLLMHDSVLVRKQMLSIEQVREGEPVMSGRLLLDPELIELLTVGSVSKPRFSMDFPAEHLQTEMDWDDLVLHPHTQKQIGEIEHWIKYNNTLLYDWGMKKKIKLGYRALFYGPPGTGKTLTATLLGKVTAKSVFRIDLSRIVSKYIGETEKNLSKLFDKAENKNWILFFDEADALFGKRTDIRDAHDKYANQEVAYLLQRIENYNGLVILASNQRANIDDAFVRRFQAVIHFPTPSPDDRYAMWLKAIPSQISAAPEVNWQMIAMRYELTGASIMNVIHYCALELLAARSNVLDLNTLERAIHREFIKEGKIV